MMDHWGTTILSLQKLIIYQDKERLESLQINFPRKLNKLDNSQRLFINPGPENCKKNCLVYMLEENEKENKWESERFVLKTLTIILFLFSF